MVSKLLGVLVGCLFLFSRPSTRAETYAHPELLIETEELVTILHDPQVRIIDAEDPALYSRAHIPGAVNVFYETLADLEERKKSGFPVSPESAAAIFGDAGIDENIAVIVYDNGEGRWASGVWFVLHFFGHENVRVLNGGFRKWVKEGRPVTQEAPSVDQKRFAAKPHPNLIVTLDWLKENWLKESARTPSRILLDARSFQEFIGTDLRGIARGGHVPGAVHLEWVKTADKLGSFKPAEQLKEVFAQRGITPDLEVVTYCRTGVGRATDLLFALQLLGYEKLRLYTGSWQEWGNDPTLPLEK
jgi:thiosulfate/3-mercaptopyruvate sulfurtransferase